MRSRHGWSSPGMVRASASRGGEPGLRPLNGALDELGFEAVDAGEIVASFARHLMSGLHEWSDAGFAPVGPALARPPAAERTTSGSGSPTTATCWSRGG